MDDGEHAFGSEGYEQKAIVARRRQWLFAVVPIMFLGVLFSAFHVSSGLVFVLILAAAYLCFGFSVFLFMRWSRQQHVRVAIDANGISLDGRLICARDLRNGFIRILSNGQVVVRLIGRWRHMPIDVHARDETEAELLLRSLRLDNQRSTMISYAQDGGMKRTWLRFLATSIACTAILLLGTRIYWSMQSAAGGVWFLLVPLSCIICYVFFMARQHVELVVGADGVLVRRHFRRDTFLSYALIVEVCADGNDLAIRLQSGRALRFGMGMKKALGAEHEVNAVVHRIEAARRSCAGADRSVDTALVMRGDRDVRAWLAALHEIGAAVPANYRAPTVPRDRLWRMVEEESGEPDTRVGAAIALRTHLDDHDKARLKTVAQACASPRVRAALDAIGTQADDDAIASAVESLERASRV